MRGRLLDCTQADPFSNVALEEALFRMLELPVLRVWDNQRSVVIGRAQLASAEANLDECRRRSVPVVRRFTAGGAVYNGPGNINWSLFQPGSGGDRGARVFDAAGVFSRSADVVLRALALCGVEGRFDPPNRIVNNKGKISGMAAYISAHGVLCHGTLLAFSDLEELEELSRPTEGALEARYPRSRHAVVSNCGVGRSEFVGALAEALGGDYSPAPLTGGERDLAGQLVAQKYSRASWNLGDPFALDYL